MTGDETPPPLPLLQTDASAKISPDDTPGADPDEVKERAATIPWPTGSWIEEEEEEEEVVVGVEGEEEEELDPLDKCVEGC